MPDWLSHVIIALIICEVFSIKRKSLVMLGALLPDLLVKVELSGMLFSTPSNLYWLVAPLHTPIGALLTTMVITPLFRQDRKKTFYQLTIGWFSHFAFDLTNKHLLIGQLNPLFPLSWRAFDLGIVWPDEFWLYIIPLLIIYMIVMVAKKNGHGTLKNKHLKRNLLTFCEGIEL